MNYRFSNETISSLLSDFKQQNDTLLSTRSVADICGLFSIVLIDVPMWWGFWNPILFTIVA